MTMVGGTTSRAHSHRGCLRVPATDLVGLGGERVAEDIVSQVTLACPPGVIAAIRRRQLPQLHITDGGEVDKTI